MSACSPASSCSACCRMRSASRCSAFAVSCRFWSVRSRAGGSGCSCVAEVMEGCASAARHLRTCVSCSDSAAASFCSCSVTHSRSRDSPERSPWREAKAVPERFSSSLSRARCSSGPAGAGTENPVKGCSVAPHNGHGSPLWRCLRASSKARRREHSACSASRFSYSASRRRCSFSADCRRCVSSASLRARFSCRCSSVLIPRRQVSYCRRASSVLSSRLLRVAVFMRPARQSATLRSPKSSARAFRRKATACSRRAVSRSCRSLRASASICALAVSCCRANAASRARFFSRPVSAS